MRSPRRSLCATMLGLQAVVLGLTTPVMISIANIGVVAALSVGLGLAAACILVAGTLRWAFAYWAGWAIQVASLALGVVVPMMFLLGAVFAGLWATAYLLGGRIEREQAERDHRAVSG